MKKFLFALTMITLAAVPNARAEYQATLKPTLPYTVVITNGPTNADASTVTIFTIRGSQMSVLDEEVLSGATPVEITFVPGEENDRVIIGVNPPADRAGNTGTFTFELRQGPLGILSPATFTGDQRFGFAIVP